MKIQRSLAVLGRKVVFAAAYLGFAQVLSLAQPSNAANPPGQVASASAQNPSFAMLEAKALASVGNVVGAEQRLILLNGAAPNTPGWYLETSQRLIHLGGNLRRESPNRVAAVMNQALRRLSEADSAAGSAGDRRAQANAKALTAFIHERYRGDRASALASYRAALQLDPNDRSSQEAVERLQLSEAILRARTKKVNR